MLKKDLITSLLEKALLTGGDKAQLFIENTKSHSIRMMDGKVDANRNTYDKGVGLRITHDLDSYYGYTSDLSNESLNCLVENLSSSINDEIKTDKVNLKEIKIKKKHQAVKSFDSVSLKDKLDLMYRASEIMKNYNPMIKKTIVNFLDESQEVTIASSDGRLIKDTRVRTRIFLTAIAIDESGVMQDGSTSDGASAGFEFYENIDIEAMAKEAAKIAITMIHADNAPSGVMDVVIDNGFGGVIFHEACGHALEATSVGKNQSVFANKLGQKIASDVVTAIDDATIDHAWGSANFDDDGYETKCNILIKDGILNSYIIDSHNEKRMNMPHTSGSRRESYRFEPTSRMSNTYIANGKSSFEEIIKATKKGLYAKTMGGGSVDPSTGEFNFAVNEGYLIEDGKITKPVKGASIIGNGAETLFKIDMVANNLKRARGMCGSVSGSIPADVGQPTIRVKDMIVGGSNNE